MNSIGRVFRVSILGESHGKAVGCLIDGCPAGLPLSATDFREDLERRRPGREGTTERQEKDDLEIVSGVHNGRSTGAPILLLIPNADIDSKPYLARQSLPRPGHADLTAKQKFGGFNDSRGGGHFSGRLTAALVAAGVIAKKIILPVKISARIDSIAGSSDFEGILSEAKENGDSVGGIIECTATMVPAGIGEPFFDSVESAISHMAFSIPAVKGIEFGAGFKCATMRGSEFNDQITSPEGKTATNHSGGINGGITNGNELVFRIAVRPTSSIAKPVGTIDMATGRSAELSTRGRHDACIALRVPPVLEAVTAIALADLLLLENKIPRVIK